MTDALLSGADRMEALSLVYARAVAARAGYVTSVPDPDRDGVDLRIQAGGAMRPAIELQMKATGNLGAPKDGRRSYPLKRRNYDLLRDETQTPRLLVVLDLPKDEEMWMTLTNDNLILRRRAYWLNLRGWDETANQTSVTVHLPLANLFNVGALRELMEQSRKGRIE